MSNGTGHIMDMINRLKQNRSQKASNRAKFKGNNRKSIYSDKKVRVDKFNFKKIPKSELLELKRKIRAESKRERRRELILQIIIGMIIFLMIIFFFKEMI